MAPANTALHPLAGPQYAAIYARVSREEQKTKGYSLETQLEECLAFAQKEGYTVLPEHVFSEHYTGKSLTRPALSKLRDLIDARAIQAVFVHDLDRLSRTLAHQLLLMDECTQKEIAFRMVLTPDTDDSPDGKLLTNFKGVIAEYERLKIIERTSRGRRGRAKAGHVPYGRRTFGYRYVKHADKGAHYEIDPVEAALVRRIFDLYVNERLSLEAIAARLTAEGIPLPGERFRTLSARVWHRQTIGNMLRNETYIGKKYDWKTQSLPGETNPDKKTRHRATPRESWIEVAVPRIIDQEPFDAAQAQLVRNKIQSKRNRKHDYLLVGGRLRCGQCGRAMIGSTNGEGYQDYRCTRQPFEDVITPHTRRSVQALAIEPVVWAAVERVLHNPALIATEIERQRDETSIQQGAWERDRVLYQQQLSKCDKDLKRWEVAYLGEVIDLADFKAKKAEIDVRRASAAQELARLDEHEQAREQALVELTSLTEYCTRVWSQLADFTSEEKQRALGALDIRVTWQVDGPPTIRGSIPLPIVSSLSA